MLITKTEKTLQEKLDVLDKFCGIDGHTTEALLGEIQALKLTFDNLMRTKRTLRLFLFLR